MSTGYGQRTGLAKLRNVPRDVGLCIVAGTLATVALELLLASGRLESAIAGYLGAYVGFTVLSLRRPKCVGVLQAFALLSVFRLVNLSLPVFVDLTVYWLLSLYLAVLPATLLAIRNRSTIAAAVATATSVSDGTPALESPSVVRDPLSWSDARRPRGLLTWPQFEHSLVTIGTWVTGLVIAGVALAVLDRAATGSIALVPERTPEAVLLLGLLAVLAAVVEELLFRGVLQATATRWIGAPAGVGVASLAYAATHLPAGPTAAATALVAGLVYGVAYDHTDSVAAPILTHALVNVLLVVVLPATALVPAGQ